METSTTLCYATDSVSWVPTVDVLANVNLFC